MCDDMGYYICMCTTVLRVSDHLLQQPAEVIWDGAPPMQSAVTSRMSTLLLPPSSIMSVSHAHHPPLTPTFSAAEKWVETLGVHAYWLTRRHTLTLILSQHIQLPWGTPASNCLMKEESFLQWKSTQGVTFPVGMHPSVSLWGSIWYSRLNTNDESLVPFLPQPEGERELETQL